MNKRAIMYTLGCVMNIEAACMSLSLICALITKDYTDAKVFGACILLCLLLGIAFTRRRPQKKTIYAKDGFIIVALSWIVISILGAIPFVMSGCIPNFIDAFFETVSGFTTTGASILTDVEKLPKSILFWRSFTHWIGGMGVLVFLVALLPLSEGENMYIIRAESPGPSVGKLVPRVRTTAKILYMVYLSLTVIEIISLLICKMDLFEALTLSFGTAGTGGFGIANASIGGYSPSVQTVIGVFMMLFGIDFTFYYLLLIRSFKSVLKMEEVRYYLGIIAVSTVIIFISILKMFPTAVSALRASFFQVSSIITTTGYSTVDFDKWPMIAKSILVLLMFFGACAGSTGGGIKVSRIIIFLKSITKELKTVVHPRSVHKIRMNGKVVDHETVRGVNVYMAAYLTILVASILIISIDNLDFTTNFTAVTATLNNIGPGLAKVGPARNFSQYSMLSKLVLSADMLVGRLEILPMLVLVSPHTWRK